MSRSFPGVVFLLRVTGLLTIALPAYPQDLFLQATGLVRAILIEKVAFVPGEPEMISTSRAYFHIGVSKSCHQWQRLHVSDGGLLTAAGTPATTRLGTLSGPGGHAVIFLDGHVTWGSDATKP